MNPPPLFDKHFPACEKEFYGDRVSVYWFDANFSQSRYPPGQTTSQACTLICLIVAQLLCNTGYFIWDAENCKELNVIIAKAIIKGNSIHARIVKEGLIPHLYLNIEEALLYGGNSLETLKEWKFRVIHNNIKSDLCGNIKFFLHKWNKSPKSTNLFMFLIAAGKTVLFIFQEKTRKITFFDPHRHSVKSQKSTRQKGLVVAQTILEKLDLLCEWYLNVILHWELEVNQYELSFLYDHKNASNTSKTCTCETAKSGSSN